MPDKFLFCILLSLISFCSFGQKEKWAEWETEADTLMNHQEFKKATELYTRIVDASQLKERENYRALYKRAVSHYSAGEFQEASKDLDIFIPQFPDSYQAFILKALVFRQLNDVDNQLINLEKAIQLQGGNPDLIRWRAALLTDKGKNAEALADLLLVRKFQDDAELETTIGFNYYSLGKLDSALMSLNKSIELDVNYQPAYMYAGSFCLQEERFELALKYLNLALRIDPANADVMFYKGVALVELKKLDEGCRCLSKAFKAGQDEAADYLKEYCYEIYK